jgi:hypothetical protein
VLKHLTGDRWELEDKTMDADKAESLARYIGRRSKEICADNECTEDNHNCESYAYINEDMDLLDICCPDYFCGSRKRYAAVPLPWEGTGAELIKAVEDDLNQG